MIFIADGVPGSGKSYCLSQEIAYDLSRGSIVHTNIHVIHAEMLKYVHEKFGVIVPPENLVFHDNGKILWDQFAYICPKGTRTTRNKIYFDEFHKYANAREFKNSFNQHKANFIFATEHRHFHIDICLISQDRLNIDSQFRRLAQFYRRYRDLQEFKVPMMGKIWPFPHTLELICDYDGKTVMHRNIIPRTKRGFEIYISESAQLEENFAPIEKRGVVFIDQKKQTDLRLERIGWSLILIQLALCVFLFLL